MRLIEIKKNHCVVSVFETGRNTTCHDRKGTWKWKAKNRCKIFPHPYSVWIGSVSIRKLFFRPSFPNGDILFFIILRVHITIKNYSVYLYLCCSSAPSFSVELRHRLRPVPKIWRPNSKSSLYSSFKFLTWITCTQRALKLHQSLNLIFAYSTNFFFFIFQELENFLLFSFLAFSDDFNTKERKNQLSLKKSPIMYCYPLGASLCFLFYLRSSFEVETLSGTYYYSLPFCAFYSSTRQYTMWI